jgi:NTP pyrophosphatase (non-canonical NTP hydrolase)
MESSVYQDLSRRTLLDRPNFQISDEEVMLVWSAVGLAGEAGEIVEMIKKVVFHRHHYDKESLVKELGDLMWYVAAVCSTSGISLDEVMERNVEKLLERFPNGFTAEDSIRRVDVVPR